MRYFRFLLLFIYSLLLVPQVQAQEFYPSQRTWAKTRIQYQKFAWKYLANQNFEVYYFGKNEALARTTLQILDGDFQRITNLLSYSPYQKTRIFVYPSGSELAQSNSGISYADAQEAADENREKFRIEIAFQNQYQDYKQNLLRQLAHVYIHDILYGGSIRDALQSSLLLSVPEWFSSGLAAYVAAGETAEMNQYMFQVVVANKVRKPALARGLEAEFIGQSIWSYIAKTYGPSQISNIVNLTRIIRNEQSSISSTLRKPISKFLKEWFEFYVSEAKQYQVNVQDVAKKSLLAIDLTKGERLRDFQLSPDGSSLAYVMDDAGRYRLMVKSMSTQVVKEVFKTGLKDPLRKDGGVVPIIQWSKKQELLILYHQEGKNFLNTYQLAKQSLRFLSKKNLGEQRFLDFELNASGQQMLVRSFKQGQVDVGIYDLRRNRLTSITQDANQESEAHWLGKEGDVVYLTDRIIDSTYQKEKGLLAMMHWGAEDPSNPQQLFLHKGLIRHVRPVSDSLIYFLSESATGQELVSYHSSDQKLYQTIVKSGDWSNFRWVNDLLVVKQRNVLQDQMVLYSAKQVTAIPAYLWYPMLPDTAQVVSQLVPNDESKRSTDIRKSRIERQQALRLRKDSNRLQGPLDYENSFVINGSEGNFKIDPIRGLGYSMDMKMNDLMENHLLKVGGYLSANIKNIDLWGEYAYLANKIDWTMRIDRKILDQETEVNAQKVRYNRAELKAVYPLNLQSKFSVSGMFTSNRAIDQYNLSTPEDVSTFVGGRLTYTFDNTVHWAENLQTGFRLFSGVEFQQSLQSQAFTRMNLDARYYLKISNSLFLASRLSASHAVGGAATQTLLGGMDNWIFIDREARNKENPLGTAGIAGRDIFMCDFATSMRGFKMNKLSGNSHVLLNAELRVPLKSLIGTGYSKSQFVNSFQMVGFFDMGSAWTGSNPFSRSNGFNTNTYGGNTNPFQATVTDFRNPFLFGYGLGARANIVGYFIKLDYAYGIENDEIISPLTYLTLGHDF
jgi:hypothetical protein